MLRPQLHASSVVSLSRCGHQWMLTYLMGHRLPPGVAMIAGTGTDAGVTADMTEKLKSGTLLPPDVVKDVARDAVMKEWEKGVALDEEERIIGEEILRGQVCDKAVRLASVHHEQAAPIISPIAVQRPFSISLDDWLRDERGIDVQMDLVGTPDLEEANSIRDTKAKAKMPGAMDIARYSVQMAIYGLKRKVLGEGTPKHLILDCLVDNKEPVHRPVITEWNDDLIPGVLDRVANAAKLVQLGVKDGVFIPASPDSWACSKKFCGFYGTDLCGYWKRPKSLMLPEEKPKKPAPKKTRKTKKEKLSGDSSADVK